MKILMEKQYRLHEMLTAFNRWAGWTSHDYRKYLYQETFGNFVKDVLDVCSPGDYGTGIKPQNITFAYFDEESDEYVLKDYVRQMLNEFYIRYCDYFAAADESETDTPEEQTMLDFYAKLFNVLNVTYPKYAPIIKALTDNENKLMDALSRDYEDSGGSDGTVTQRFNDTPQDGGAYEDDNHTTNINESVSNATSSLTHNETYDNKYVLEKLNYIRDNLSNIYTEWENKVATILWR